MAARVIHFGVDQCYRLNVLRRAGYEVDTCGNLIQLREILESKGETDALMVSDSDGSVRSQAISLARSRTSAPIILFPDSIHSYSTAEVDLVVPCFTPPEEWLLDLANLIVHSRAVREYSRLLKEESKSLRRASLAARVKSFRERERARRIIGARFPSPL